MRMLRILALLLFAASISCDRSYKGTADMQGYLMYECGNSDPMGNVTVSFYSLGTVYLSATTDAHGYFHIKGDYDIKVSGAEAYETYLSIESNGQNGGGFGSIKLMRYPPDRFNDTLYYYNSTLSIFIIDIEQSSLGNANDTLEVETINYRQNSFNRKYYVGPFEKNQILDTILTHTNSHIGYDEGLDRFTIAGWYNYNLNRHSARYPWVTGQPNNACGNYTNVYLKLD
jgi:hypothetical protein